MVWKVQSLEQGWEVCLKAFWWHKGTECFTKALTHDLVRQCEGLGKLCKKRKSMEF